MHRSKWKSQRENKPSSPAQQLPPTPQLPAPFLACFAKGRPYLGPVCSEWHACDRHKGLGKYWHERKRGHRNLAKVSMPTPHP